MAGARSSIRSRSSGIPKSGSTKPPSENVLKPSSHTQHNIGNDLQSATTTTSDAKKVYQNSSKSQQTNVPNSPVKSLIRQYKSIPSKQIDTKANRSDDDVKTNSIQSQGTFSTSRAPKPGQNNKTRVNRQHLSPTKIIHHLQSNSNITPNQSPTLNTGIGLGGGSVPQNAFSYISSGSPIQQNKKSPKRTTSSPKSQTSGLKPPSSTKVSAGNLKKKNASKSPERDLNEIQDLNPRSSTKKSIKDTSKLSLKSDFQKMETNSLKNSSNSKTGPNPKISSKVPQPISLPLESSKTSSIHPSVTFHQSSSSGCNLDTAKLDTPLKHNNMAGETTNIGKSYNLFNRLNRSFKASTPKAISIPTVPKSSIHLNASQNIESSVMANNGSAKQTSKLKSNITPPKPVLLLPFQVVSPLTPNAIQESKTRKHRLVKNNESSAPYEKDADHKTQKEKKSLFGASKSARANSSGAKVSKLPAKTNASTNTDYKASAASEVKSLLMQTKTKRNLATFMYNAKHTGASNPSLQASKQKSLEKNFTASHKDVVVRTDSTVVLTTTSTPVMNSQPTSVSPTQGIQAVASTIKSSSLMKTPSGSSIFTNSSSSNVSSVTSLRTKKVSFQSDITICDASGISTCSNGLRSPDLGQESNQRLHLQDVCSLSEEACEDLFFPDKSTHNSQFLFDENSSPIEWMGKDAFDKRKRSFTPLIPDSCLANQNIYPVTKYGYLHSYDCEPYSSENVLDTLPPNSGTKLSTTISHEVNGGLAVKAAASLFRDECKEFALSCESPIPFVVCNSELEVKESMSKGAENSQIQIVSGYCGTNETAVFNERQDLLRRTRISQTTLPSNKVSPTPQTTITTLPNQEIHNHEQIDPDVPPYYECCEIPSQKSCDCPKKTANVKPHVDLALTSDKSKKSFQPKDGTKEVSGIFEPCKCNR